MSLAQRLAAAKTPEEHDALLARVWSALKDTEQAEAISYTINNLRQPALDALLSSNSTDPQRCHAAGIVVACDILLREIDACVTLDPTLFKPPPPEEDLSDRKAFDSLKEDPIY